MCVSSQSLQPHQAGWYPDPAGGQGLRWHDGQGWTGKISHAQQRQAVRPLGHGFAKLADWLCRLLWLCCALSGVTLVVHVWGYAAPENLAIANAPDPTAVNAYLLVTLAVTLLAGLAMLVTGVVWLVWQYQAARSAPGARTSGAMNVAGWFIPFANVVLVPLNLANLCRVYADRRPDSKELTATPGLVLGWWTCWMVSAFVQIYAAVSGAGAQTVADLQGAELVGAFQELFVALSAALAATLVRTLSWQALVVHAEISQGAST
jgi:hypothetical protein